MALTLTFWDNQNNPLNTTVDHLMDALHNDDMREGLMYEPCTMDDVLDSTTPADTLIMDAIISQYSKLTAKMNIMQRVMSRSGVDFKNAEGENVPLTVVGFQISDPFMRLGTANVVALFELSDGQTVSIYFHNPDVTPKKITPQDEVISFKWLLNKKDITIVVAPEKGKDIDVRQVAMRIMKIAAKNSAAFARQNKNRQEKVAKVTALRERVAQKEKILAQKLKKIDELKYLKAQEEVDQLLAEEEAQKQAKIEAEKPDTKIERITLNWSEGADVTRKVFNTLDELQKWFLQTYPADYLASMRPNSYSKNQVEFDLVHKDGSKESYQERIDVGLGNGDFDPNREHFMETGGSKYKERLETRGVRKFDYTSSLTTLSAVPIDNSVTEQEEPPIAITGKEFGEFDTSTHEGKTALREKAFEYLKSLADNDEKVFCKAVNADVGFTKSAAKKYKSLGGNAIKLKLASMIKDIIKNSTLVRKDIESYDSEEQKAGITYDVVKTKVMVEGEEYGVRTVLRHLSNGKYQYDLQVKDDFDTILDSIKGSPARLTKSDVASLKTDDGSGAVNKTDFLRRHSIAQFELQPNDTLTLDDVSSGYVLNLFVFDKDGNEIKDDFEENNEFTANGIDLYDVIQELEQKGILEKFESSIGDVKSSISAINRGRKLPNEVTKTVILIDLIKQKDTDKLADIIDMVMSNVWQKTAINTYFNLDLNLNSKNIEWENSIKHLMANGKSQEELDQLIEQQKQQQEADKMIQEEARLQAEEEQKEIKRQEKQRAFDEQNTLLDGYLSSLEGLTEMQKGKVISTLIGYDFKDTPYLTDKATAAKEIAETSISRPRIDLLSSHLKLTQNGKSALREFDALIFDEKDESTLSYYALNKISKIAAEFAIWLWDQKHTGTMDISNPNEEPKEKENNEKMSGNKPETDEQTKSDIQYLQDVIDGKVEMIFDEEFYPKFEAICHRLYATEEELVTKAVDAYMYKSDEYAVETE